MNKFKRCACPDHKKITKSGDNLVGSRLFRRIKPRNPVTREGKSTSLSKWVLRALKVDTQKLCRGQFICMACISYAHSHLQSYNPAKKTPAEFYLDVVVEKPKLSDGVDKSNVHSYAGQPGSNSEWEANKENNGCHTSPPSPPPSPPPSDDEQSYRGPGPGRPTKRTRDDEQGHRGPGPGRPSKETPGDEQDHRSPGPGRTTKQARAARGRASTKDVSSQYEPLSLPRGTLTAYLVEVRSKQQQIVELQNRYNSLEGKVQFRHLHPDWSGEIPEPLPDAPFLTLREDQLEREPALEPLELLGQEMLLPLTPNEAFRAVAALRKKVLDVQVALMFSRIQSKFRELRLQEVTADHRRYKATVRQKQRRANREEQLKDSKILQLERRCNLATTSFSELRLKTKMAEKTGNKKKRLTKGLEQIFTPMQLRVIRTGKKPRWKEEDIRRAIELKKLVTRRGYAYIRRTMKIPLPSPMIMKRGASRFEALKPLYEQMVTANVLKYSTKKKPNVPKKEDHSYEYDMDQHQLDQQEGLEQEIEAEVSRPKPRKKKRPTEEAVSAESSSTEPVQEKPIKRRKKRRTVQEPPRDEFEPLGVVGRASGRGSASGSTAVRARPRPAWSEPRPSWEGNRFWETQYLPVDEYGRPREERRPRPRPAWSANTADFE